VQRYGFDQQLSNVKLFSENTFIYIGESDISELENRTLELFGLFLGTFGAFIRKLGTLENLHVSCGPSP
jgi:hypothetical protein